MPELSLKAIASLLAAGGAAVAIGLHLYGDHQVRQQLASMTQERDRLAESNRALAKANADFVTSLGRQNNAVEALKKAGEARETAAKESNAAALAATQKQYAAALAKLQRAMPVPGDACRSADVVLTEAIKARK